MKTIGSFLFLCGCCVPLLSEVSTETSSVIVSANQTLLLSYKDGKMKDFLHQLLQKEKEGNKKKKKNSTGMIRRGHVQEGNFSWDWGARTDTGRSKILDEWDFSASHTRFHTKAFKEDSVKGIALPWKIRLDLADVEMGRIFSPQEQMELRPHAGLRGAWINKKIQVRDEMMRIEEVQGNNCAGLGIRSGLDSLWRCSRTVSFFGDSAVSLLAGYHNINKRIKEDIPRSNIAVAEISFGMQYEAILVRQKMVTFRCGYEMNYLFNQTKWLERLEGQESPFLGNTLGLSLQGITLGIRLDF